MKTRTTLVAAVAALALVGGGTAYALTSTQEPAPVETTVSAPTDSPTPDATPTGDTTEPVVAESPAALTAEDEAYLKYVDTEKPPTTVLGEYSDAELVALGHDACSQIEAGTAPVDLHLVKGEEPSWSGDYLDTSAIFNGALYNYCPELIEDVD